MILHWQDLKELFETSKSSGKIGGPVKTTAHLAATEASFQNLILEFILSLRNQSWFF